MENEKKKLKTMIISMSIVICMFVLAGIVLTFVLKAKQNDLSSLNSQKTQLEQQYDDAKQQDNYYYKSEDSEEYSDNYKNDHAKYDDDKGHDGDKIIKTQ